jgi:hypothetical protein
LALYKEQTREEVMSKRICLLIFSCAILLLAGCGHNAGVLTLGTRAHIGIDPQNVTAAITYSDGLNISDISRENSAWVVVVNEETGVAIGKDGTVKGVKSIYRVVGPQMNGYLVDLAKTDPALAKKYAEAMKAFWEARKAYWEAQRGK